MGVEMVCVPAGADLELDIQLEGVAEGVLVTATVTAPLGGECARCLEPFTSVMSVRFQELFTLAQEVAGPDGYVLDGGLLDLEPALRDALVLELPLAPLCAGDCPGLCARCGIRLADAPPGHGHEDRGPMWEALKDVRVSEPE
ncbi:MAG: YceD family protein [Streptosporangiaceae bacterium]